MIISSSSISRLLAAQRQRLNLFLQSPGVFLTSVVTLEKFRRVYLHPCHARRIARGQEGKHILLIRVDNLTVCTAVTQLEALI